MFIENVLFIIVDVLISYIKTSKYLPKYFIPLEETCFFLNLFRFCSVVKTVIQANVSRTLRILNKNTFFCKYITQIYYVVVRNTRSTRQTGLLFLLCLRYSYCKTYKRQTWCDYKVKYNNKNRPSTCRTT